MEYKALLPNFLRLLLLSTFLSSLVYLIQMLCSLKCTGFLSVFAIVRFDPDIKVRFTCYRQKRESSR